MTLLTITIALILSSCGDMDVNVSDSEHRVIIENLCDKETFPIVEERKQCILDLLEVLNGK